MSACVCPLAFEESSAKEVLACFPSQNQSSVHPCLPATCAVSHNSSKRHVWCTSQYLRILIQERRQECNLPSLTIDGTDDVFSQHPWKFIHTLCVVHKPLILYKLSFRFGGLITLFHCSIKLSFREQDDLRAALQRDELNKCGCNFTSFTSCTSWTLTSFKSGSVTSATS
jgi:hypothetical protein